MKTINLRWMYPHYRHDEFMDVTDEVWAAMYQAKREMAALAHATPTQARRVHAYYIAGIKQPEISRREGIHSSKVSVAIRRGLRNMRRCYDDLFQTE